MKLFSKTFRSHLMSILGWVLSHRPISKMLYGLQNARVRVGFFRVLLHVTNNNGVVLVFFFMKKKIMYCNIGFNPHNH